MSDTINRYDCEANQGKDEGEMDCAERADSTRIDDPGLQGREDTASENRHNQACRAELGILARPLESHSVDSGEHQRHAEADCHKAVKAGAAAEKDDKRGEQHSTKGEDEEHPGSFDIFKKGGADEP